MTDKIEVFCPKCGAYICELTHVPVTGEHLPATMFKNLWHGRPARTGDNLLCRCTFGVLSHLRREPDSKQHYGWDIRRNGEKVARL